MWRLFQELAAPCRHLVPHACAAAWLMLLSLHVVWGVQTVGGCACLFIVAAQHKFHV